MAENLSINIAPELAGGKYSNLAIIGHSATEFVLDFASVLPGAANAQVQSRVILAPEHAKRLLFAMQDNIKKYESQFGEIVITKQAPAPSKPITFGEA